MHVAELLDAFLLVVHKKTVKPRLPEGPLRAPHCHRQFERVNQAGDRAFLRFAHEKVNVFGHHDVSRNDKSVSEPGTFQGVFKQVARQGVAEMLKAMETTEGEEVEAPRVFVPDESARH